MKKKDTVEREFNTKPSKDFLDMIAPSTVKFRQVYGRKKCVVKPVLPVCT